MVLLLSIHLLGSPRTSPEGLLFISMIPTSSRLRRLSVQVTRCASGRATSRASTSCWRTDGLVLRRLLGAALALLVSGLSCLTSTAAHANGRLPGATGLAIHPTDEHQLLLGLSYGLALSRDGGASWTWMCEEQIEGNGGDVDPSIVVTSNGTLVVLSLTNGGVLVSGDDGCSFAQAMGPLQGNRGVDLTLDPSQPGRVLALLSTIVAEVDNRPRYRNLLAQSLDHGKSWQVLAEFPGDFSPETVEIAPSDANRIYVSGTASADPLQGMVERSDDGGRTWTRTTVRLPRGSGSLFLSGIHPHNPDRLWFRVPGRGDIYGVLPARLWVSTDGAASFDQVADTQYGMLGFALSPDGNRIAFGGPLDGLFVSPSDASAAPSKVSNLQVKCLRWRSSGLYVCAGEPTDPYSLGHAAEPTQGFVPLWHRANTCRAACPPPSALELTCRAPWDTIAPLVGADSALCDGSLPTPDVGSTESSGGGGSDAGSGAVGHSIGDDGGGGTAVDASPVTPEPAKAAPAPSTGGCTASFPRDASTPWWLAPVLMLAGWTLRSRRPSPRRRT